MSEALQTWSLYQQLQRLPEHLRGEIINGQLYAMTRPFAPHAVALGAIFGKLWAEVGQKRTEDGWIFQLEPELHLSTPDEQLHVLSPDLAAWKRQKLNTLPRKGYLSQTPDWVCEVLSEGTARMDRGPKRRIYHRAGVRWLWLVDPIEHTVEAYRSEGEFWVLIASCSGEEQANIEPFQGIFLDLSSLWADIATTDPR